MISRLPSKTEDWIIVDINDFLNGNHFWKNEEDIECKLEEVYKSFNNKEHQNEEDKQEEVR